MKITPIKINKYLRWTLMIIGILIIVFIPIFPIPKDIDYESEEYKRLNRNNILVKGAIGGVYGFLFSIFTKSK